MPQAWTDQRLLAGTGGGGHFSYGAGAAGAVFSYTGYFCSEIAGINSNSVDSYFSNTA